MADRKMAATATASDDEAPLQERIDAMKAQFYPDSNVAFERVPNRKAGTVTVAFAEEGGGDRIAGTGPTTAGAVDALEAKLNRMGGTQ